MLDEAREKGKQEAGNGVAQEMAMESIQTGVVCRLIQSTGVEERRESTYAVLRLGHDSRLFANFQSCRTAQEVCF